MELLMHELRNKILKSEELNDITKALFLMVEGELLERKYHEQYLLNLIKNKVRPKEEPNFEWYQKNRFKELEKVGEKHE